ncbi:MULTISPECIES: bifunctional diguanylate cyclase/phosphodiesterase [unclassified Thioalkalivibrio]|uniref:putative bifunctional diguanylate cyclase/phosphodiesterase n=1 Tax=unclassified Thioalkalivibrio TaxID=2621013 RepID=UPI00035EC9EE|nr:MULTISPECIES: EAL domain-containing protein [unclassified Thioalkalivibrio]
MNTRAEKLMRQHTVLASGLLLALLLVPVVIWLLGIDLPRIVPGQHLTAFHTGAELFAVVVAVLVFAVGYHVIDRRRVAASLLLACAFLAVALFDFLHLMTYPAMPDFITPNSTQQTLFFWLAARLVGAAALLAYVALPMVARSDGPPRGVYLAGSLLLVAVLAWVGLWHADILPPLFDPVSGLTPFKLGLEAIVIALHLATLAILALRRDLLQRPGMPLVAAALVISMGSGMFFMFYEDLTDTPFVLGHLYKLAAYLLIYQGLFLESVRSPLERLHQAHRDIEMRERRYQQLVETAPDGVLVTDTEGRIVMANRNIERLFGYPRQQLIGQPVERLVPDRLRERHRTHRQTQARTINRRTMGQVPHLRGQRIDGTEFPVDISLNAFDDTEGRRITAFIRDITDRQRREARIQHQATHDSLTELPNRWLLHDRLTQGIAQAEHNDHPIAVMLLDLDNFKMINDTFGHDEGDQLLKAVAARLQGALDQEATIGRFGGDEFMILLTHVADEQAIARVAQRILGIFDTPFQTEHARNLVSSGSLGIAMFPRDAQDDRSLVRYADMAMYEAKHSGRNTWAFFSQHLDAQVHEEQRLQQHLQQALENAELELHYQPLLEVASNRVIGVEALARWTDAELGPVAPARFVASAEGNGLILPLGDWVIREACEQLAQWSRSGVGLRVAINISAMQFRQHDLVERLRAALEATGAPPERLEIEVTETVAMADVALTHDQLRGLKALGIRVALDDFGTGYSSLAYLKSLPIDKLKIDRSFIADIGEDPESEMILRSIVHLGHSLGLTLVAEGVETDAQRTFLREIGCDLYQGWLHSHAMAAGALKERLQHETV